MLKDLYHEPFERVVPLTTQKTTTAFRTIGEVANELNVSPHVLRFWESKFKQIKPHKRRGGHRYYRQMDIDLIKEVKTLLYERGFTIKGAQNYLKEQQKGAPKEQTSFFEMSLPEDLPLAPVKAALSDAQKSTILKELRAIKTLLTKGI